VLGDKMNKRNNKIIILISVAVIFCVALFVFILNYSKDDTSFSILEKKWLNDNENNIIDVSVYNDVSIFGESGNGIIFDYLDKFTKDHGIDFNKVSYIINDSTNNYKDLSFKILNSSEKINENDILLYEDKYVIVSKDNKVFDKMEDLSSISIGVNTDDLSLASFYLKDASNVSYKPYTDIELMISALDNKEVSCLLLPFNQYLKTILENDLNIVYHLEDMGKKYVLTVKDNKTLLAILKKYTLRYQEEYYEEAYKSNFINLIFRAKEISEEEKMGYNANSYVYGYVTNVPFEVKEEDFFGGTLSNYLSGFEELFSVDFKTVRYDDVASLKNALSSGEIDLAFANFNTEGVNVDRIFTSSIFEEEYVVLSKTDKYLNSIRSLKDKEVYTVNNTYLYSYLSRNGVVPRAYENTDELIRNVDDNWTLIMDVSTYEYYKNKKLSTFNVIYEGTLDNEYKFVIRDVSKNETFATLFSFYVTMINYNNFRYTYNISDNYLTDSFSTILKVGGIIFLLLLVAILAIIIIKKKRSKEKIIKKDEKLKFIDVMTSLKNRNYLNYNMAKWEENVIYPQSFVVIDLNNIKYVNDNHGHEEGDNVIKKAASILIINQLENTDIMRTDGNEFLVYLVGYSEKDVIAYTRKIYKELKELPYGFGASVGYSMITDDIKTIDDAINEATLEMRKAKEKNN